MREKTPRERFRNLTRHPTPKDVYRVLLSKSEADAEELEVPLFATFEDREDENRWIQIELGEKTRINFSYPYDEEPNQLISKLDISLPNGYALFNWMRQKFAEFVGPRCSNSELADIIDALFTKLLGAPPNYAVAGWIEY